VLGSAGNRATGPPDPALPPITESAFIVPIQQSAVKESAIGARHPPYSRSIAGANVRMVCAANPTAPARRFSLRPLETQATTRVGPFAS
jgi:hypothetical protein